MGWSDLLSFNVVIARPEADRNSSCRGEVTLADLSLGKTIDKATPKLQEACVNGTVIPEVEVHVTASYADPGRKTYYVYTLKDVQITSYSVGGSSEEVPVESLSLNFAEFKVIYTEFDDAGSETGDAEFKWDLKKKGKGP